MELDWLETFLAVVDRRGFTAASEQLHRSQSRVSAHIAALERDLGVRLIDRTHRPATLTAAGEVFARHAREIVSGVGSARSAVTALHGLDQGAVTVLSSPCVGGFFLPDVLAAVAADLPTVRFGVAEPVHHDVETHGLGEGVALAVLPRLTRPLPAGLHEHVLWRESYCALVPADDRLARLAGPVTLEHVLRSPVLTTGTSADGGAEVVRLASAHGIAVRPRATTDTAHTLVALVRAGLGVGLVSSAAVGKSDSDGLAVVGIDDARLFREVAAYWFEVLLATRAGRALHAAVLAAPTPHGAAPVR